MEQKNKLTEEEKAYQALRTQDMQDMPDLWSRIDAGFEEEVKIEKKVQKQRKKKQFGLIAAAVVVAVIAIPVCVITMRNQNEKRAYETQENASNAEVENAADSAASDAADSAASEETDSAASDAAESAAYEGVENAAQDTNQTQNSVIAEDSAGKTDIQNSDMEHMDEDAAAITYDEIAQAVCIQYDAQGNTVKQFDSNQENVDAKKVQSVLERCQVLAWEPFDENDEDVSCYKLELTMQDGTIVIKRCREDNIVEWEKGKTLMEDLQKIYK